MPVVLTPADYARALGEEPDPRDLMRPFRADLMRMWPISTPGQQAILFATENLFAICKVDRCSNLACKLPVRQRW
jgi:putative SOS response-associated peptidase YedK